MSDGTRSRKGCLTCRLRKKKCDERLPSCDACRARQLPCYGYQAGTPIWATNKPTWDEVRDCPEARALCGLAESRYRVARRTGQTSSLAPQRYGNVSNAFAQPNSGLETIDQCSPTSSLIPPVHLISQSGQYGVLPNTWQLVPGTVWWDVKMATLNLSPLCGKSDNRLLSLFIEVIHPITHTFYPLITSQDRDWFVNHIITDSALETAALAVSACFEHSLVQGPKINEIGICQEVRRLQSMAVEQLRPRIELFATADLSLQDTVMTGMRLLDVIMQLITLETFSMLQGSWEMHHRAARTIIRHIEYRWRMNAHASKGRHPIEQALSSLPAGSQELRSLKFCLSNFAWIDVVATATFGDSCFPHIEFDYRTLLNRRELPIDNIMGCQAWIMALVRDITLLEGLAPHVQIRTPADARSYSLELDRVGNALGAGTHLLETASADSMAEDVRLVSRIWAHAAGVFLQIMSSDDETGHFDTDAFVESNLATLEALPTRLVMRVHWPYTVVGCLATNAAHQERFRNIFGNILQQSLAPGLIWKGLMVMEECWRLRRTSTLPKHPWRRAMESLQARVLLV